MTNPTKPYKKKRQTDARDVDEDETEIGFSREP
jgi:hypothetical protein